MEARFALIRRNEILGLHERLVRDVHNVLRILFAINRQWEPDWKWARAATGELSIKPDRLAERINAIFMALAEALQLREMGQAKQDQAMLEQARAILLELVAAYPDDAEITFHTTVVHDNLGLERASIPYYVQALALGLSSPDLERALLGLGSTYRGLGDYQHAEETLRRGVREFPHNRAIQVFLAMTLYNKQSYKEAMELLLTNLLETTSDENLLYSFSFNQQNASALTLQHSCWILWISCIVCRKEKAIKIDSKDVCSFPLFLMQWR